MAERSDRLLGRLPRASRAGRLWRDGCRPILPWALLVFLQACRVLFHSTPRRSFVERVSFARSAVRRGPLSVGRHPLVGLRATDFRRRALVRFASSRALRVFLEPGILLRIE
jgi:hypothetical protein